MGAQGHREIKVLCHKSTNDRNSKMISIQQWMQTVGYRITEGSEYGWTCYGHNAYTLDSWNGHQDGHNFTIIFDTKNQTVYEVQAHDYLRQRAYRLISPGHVDQYRAEAEQQGSAANQAWDNVDYIDLEVDEDWIEKAQAIVAGQDYDTRVSVPVDFSDQELLTYMKLAHQSDMTFNAFIEQALRQAIDTIKQRDRDSSEAE
jgi:hypothetical protein